MNTPLTSGYIANIIEQNLPSDLSMAELEISIGILDPSGVFQASVPYDHFFNAVYCLNTISGDLKGHNEKKNMMTCTLTDNTRIRYVKGLSPVSITKTKLWHIDISISNHPYDMRVSCSIEKPVCLRTPQECTWYRLQERYSFNYGSKWIYDLTKVSSGNTKASACNDPPKYEIELELDLSHHNDTQDYIRLIERGLDCLGRYDENYTKIDMNIYTRGIQKNNPLIAYSDMG
jgi:hypothetical protein